MSSVSEIEEAIRNLSTADRERLETGIIARRYGLGAIGEESLAELLSSLDEAESEIDNGLGVSPDQLRRAVRSWAGK